MVKTLTELGSDCKHYSGCLMRTGALLAVRETLAARESERDTLDCTLREGGARRHCRPDALCLRCERDALRETLAEREQRIATLEDTVAGLYWGAL